MYSIGGCKANPGSWSNGFSPLPSKGNISTLSKGLEVNSINAKKRHNITVCTPIIEKRSLGFVSKFFLETSKVNPDKINTQSNKEPSWFPQTPLILYIIGLRECELFETSNKEKSEIIKLYVKIKKDDKISRKFVKALFLRIFIAKPLNDLIL